MRVTEGGLAGRVDRFAARHPARVGRYSLSLLLVRGLRRTSDVRITGLAAEMTYYALISLLPLATALGAALGFLGRFIGPDQVRDIEAAVVNGLSSVFDSQVTGDVLAPLVEGLLREERAGVAVSSIAVALWLAGRMFRAAIRALDDAYRVPERRGLVAQSLLGVALSLGAVLTLVALLSMVVVGPLLGGGQWLAEGLGGGPAFEVLWAVARWPAVVMVCGLFLATLYRYGPNVDNTWRDCLPGALFGTGALLLVAVGFQLYLDVAGPTAPEVVGADEAVAAAAQMISAVLAAVLWLWLSSIVILTGGVVNAELARMRGEASAAGEPAARTG
ncbi:hypothetical protein A7K94_0202905 [Modestobacter sp. VKM Ac-2676]|nr:hypothetical protein A7K94_0202905 [Modestobacter sp. VKM Ac-2676]